MLNGSDGSLLTSRSSLAKMEDFLLCLNIDASQLRVLGDDITDKQVLKKMLHVVPNKLEQVAILMETLLNLDVLTIEEAVGHLHAVEQRKKLPSSKDSEGRLLLTKEEWMACMKTRDGSGSFAGAHGGGSSNDGGKNANKNKGQKQNTGGGKRAMRAMKTCATTMGNAAIGPRSATRKNAMRRPKFTWPKEKRRSNLFSWPIAPPTTTQSVSTLLQL
jgi:hypothetical protein